MIWGDRIFVTSAVDDGEVTDPVARADSKPLAPEMSMKPAPDLSAKSWRVLCLDKDTGEVLWERTAHSGVPQAGRHPLNSFATPTAAVDGRHVVVFFGSEGLYCYTLEGKLVWQRDLGVLRAGYYLDSELQWGVASSVLLHRGLVIVQCDVSVSPFIVALDVETGKEIWRAKGDDFPSWSTPAVFEDQGRSVLVVVAPNYVRGLDAITGEELWRLYWGMDITTPAPVISPDLIYVAAGKGRWRPIVAIRRHAQGDITLDGGQTHNRYVAWSVKRGGPITPTPLFYRGRLYVLEDLGILSCYDGASGERLFRERVTGDYFASPVASDGILYLTSRAGDVHVVRAGPDFEMLAENSLGQPTVATPAISAGTLYFRTVQDLLAIRAGAGSASSADSGEGTLCPRTPAP